MISAVAIAASFASCNKVEQENNTPVVTPAVDGTTTLTISATSPQTKTYLVDNGDTKNTNWTKDDLVTLLGLEDKTVTATAKNTTGSAAATLDFVFSGWPAAITPGYLVFDGPLAEENKDNAVVSPVYNDNGTITATVRSLQVITNKSNMSKYANLSIGKVEENAGAYNTVMKNVCGLIKFELKGGEKTSVEDVVIKDALGNPMTGLVKVDYNEGQPVVVEVVEPADYVQVKANITNYNNKMLEGAYYACVLPGTYSPEITINHTDGSVTTLKMPENQTVTIERSQIFDFTTIYDPTPETGEGGDEPEEPEQNTINITVDFSNEPFTTNIGSSEVEDEEKEYVLKNSTYVFKIWSQTGYKIKTQNNSKCLQIVQNDAKVDNVSPNNGYIQLPGISGYKLSNVEVTINNTAKKTFYVYSQNPRQNSDQDAFVSIAVNAAPTNGVATNSSALESSVAGTAYYLYAKGQNNAGITKLVLTYK